jgi:hypothetical protein
MVGRLFTIEDERDVLEDELGMARNRLHSLERAPREGRWTRSRTDWVDAVEMQRDKIARLEHDLAGVIADLIADAEGFSC